MQSYFKIQDKALAKKYNLLLWLYFTYLFILNIVQVLARKNVLHHVIQVAPITNNLLIYAFLLIESNHLKADLPL